MFGFGKDAPDAFEYHHGWLVCSINNALGWYTLDFDVHQEEVHLSNILFPNAEANTLCETPLGTISGGFESYQESSLYLASYSYWDMDEQYNDAFLFLAAVEAPLPAFSNNATSNRLNDADELLLSIQKWGNRLANLYREAHLKQGHIPPEHKIDSFIHSKYESRQWALEGPPPTDPSVLSTGVASVPEPPSAPATPASGRSASCSANCSSCSPAPAPAPQNDLFSLDFHAPPIVTTNNHSQSTSPEQRKDVKQDILSLFSTPPAQSAPVMGNGFGQFSGATAQTASPWGAAQAPVQAPVTSMMGSELYAQNREGFTSNSWVQFTCETSRRNSREDTLFPPSSSGRLSFGGYTRPSPTSALAQALLGISLPHVLPQASASSSSSEINSIAFASTPSALDITQPQRDAALRTKRAVSAVAQSAPSDVPNQRRNRGLSLGPAGFLNFGPVDVIRKGKEVEKEVPETVNHTPNKLTCRSSFWSRKKVSGSLPLARRSEANLVPFHALPPFTPFSVDMPKATSSSSNVEAHPLKCNHTRGLSRSHSERARRLQKLPERHALPNLKCTVSLENPVVHHSAYS
ncbi:hypothetical protein BT96DRAFT_1064945 [Gymnopus androsaceus JB14]|uniref:Uncharacterized protein n=1 Tax=Gymnopus androsaceus JB14 TaxID=1447944 RepID=A0A6A4I959_9AGAR|nr:hypothetical protein BT96DRAFT_1064945 [Gymnopus androsaceus JB14]